MLYIYIAVLQPAQFYCFPSSSSSSSSSSSCSCSSSSTVLLFFLLLHNSIVFPPLPQFYCFPSSFTILLFSLLLHDEEPRIKDVLENLSKPVSRERASDLLHSMAASKDILFWTPCGQLLRKNRIIPVTNIAELVEDITMR